MADTQLKKAVNAGRKFQRNLAPKGKLHSRAHSFYIDLI